MPAGRALTPAQKRLIGEIEAGQDLVRSFDVRTGWWYWLRPTATKVRSATAESLLERGILICGAEQRVHSGYREAVLTLAKAS